MNSLNTLKMLREHGGAALTQGLSDDTIADFIRRDPQLVAAIEDAGRQFDALRDEFPELLAMDECDQLAEIQAEYVNFYADDAVNPYVSLAARGPWIITLKGAVLYDCGGYGMLGFGHTPDAVISAMSQPHVMANIMTPNLSQKRFADALDREVGHRRKDGNPYRHYLCLNSGSEAVTLAARIADINAKDRTDPGGENANQPIKHLGLAGAFHGRTDRPARYSDSTRKVYCKNLASFRDQDSLITVEPNNVEQLEQVFKYANDNGIFIEAMFLEPVMGEGNPGMPVTPEFYARARELTREHGALLLVDSIQAGLRAHGVLSIIDYPGFETLDAPDMETWSKALNAGQYPLSVVALTEDTAAIYRKGVYGNTMTTNPRALDVAVSVLNSLTPELRRNVEERGAEMVAKLKQLQAETGQRITQVQGTGLLVSAELNPTLYKCYGAGSTEEYIRKQGVNVIHGGMNALRYTPYLLMTSEEVDLVIDATRDALLNGPARAASEAA
ncbi:aminotransferase class III-fold pyridoxal phosphate-dependent enzyme [Marinihelvus fidelis]|uniref:Aminotransferase class III-fold pyridoxal phosphate-dependent enzyme n=1 Tax=Marinihelvus fidelis TaxID=2613842 RepID=A0A5N0TGW7_9GAMM|nr:aminotransferase class III-fold pyridoxal phosphate-dependent enzyme [Marinihelvus fidelis]KAA9133116.1 aminotransferase class III-fold pyridoxal phosphate-dependent enzyme [Marinihelvus fidelis]